MRGEVRAALYRWLYPVAVLIHRLRGQPPPRPPFDARRAAALIGKYVLIGVNTHDADGRLLEQRQIHGTIVAVDARQGIEVKLRGRGSGLALRVVPHETALLTCPPKRQHGAVARPAGIDAWGAST